MPGLLSRQSEIYACSDSEDEEVVICRVNADNSSCYSSTQGYLGVANTADADAKAAAGVDVGVCVDIDVDSGSGSASSRSWSDVLPSARRNVAGEPTKYTVQL